MIKFFRKIRQNLLSEGRTGKYLKYAVGEIILVVIGILIAIQLNNLNEYRKERNKEFSFLQKLKEDVNLDIRDLTKLDSILAMYQSNQDEGLELLLKAKSAKDIMTLNSLVLFNWNNIEVNRKTYNEMLNTSGIYIITNKEFLNHLNDYYALIEKYQQFIREINEDSRQNINNSNLDAFDFLRKNYGNPFFDINKLDTSWIGNYSSPTYLALSRYYTHVIGAVNGNKRRYITEILKSSNELADEIEEELSRKKND